MKWGRCAASHASSGALRRQPRFRASPGGGFAPAPGVHFARIIYALVTVINNSGLKTHPAAGAKPPREAPTGLSNICTLKKMRNERLRDWSIFSNCTHTQTSTPSTNPYDSNLRRARIHRIKSRASSEYQPVQNNSYFCPIRWNNPPVVRNETR